MRKLVRDNSPGELRKINLDKLTKMGISESLAEAFLSNAVYDPQVQTILTGALEQLENVKGRDRFVTAAALASDRSAALFYQTTAQMMAGYHTSVAPLESIDRLRRTPCVRTKDNKALVLLPLDFIFRTAEVQAKFDKLNSALSESGITSGKELWVTGRIDQSAVEMLKAAGWGYQEKAGSQNQEETGKKLMKK